MKSDRNGVYEKLSKPRACLTPFILEVKENLMNKSHYQSNKEWRHRNPAIRHAGKKRYYQKTQNATNDSKRYDTADEELVFNHDISDSELSDLIGRSVQSIQGKRHNILKKMRETGM